MKSPVSQIRRLATGLVAIFLVACSSEKSSLQDTSNNSLVPGASVEKLPDGSISHLGQLKRFRGQTEFLTPSPYLNRSLGRAAAPEAAANAPAGGGRAEQESDIYKVGKPGSKLLFLLNNSRGLQVVSFAKGADQPELLGRKQATGNYPDDMYYDEKNDRLLVLERLYYDASGNYNYSEVQSRLLVYDVSKPETPEIAAELPIAGSVADSRIVGEVLYVASSVRPDQNSDRQKERGVVTSFDLSKKNIQQVATYKMALPAVYGEKMNIQTVSNADGSLSYYLVAILSETGWGWWDRQSLVEVVDISDEHGEIKPVMSVSAKGQVLERSQTLIKNNTLIVTSQYLIEDSGTGNNRNIARIAVETFTLPVKNSEVITAKEAQYRQLHMERALEGKEGEELETARAELLKDAKLGLQGRFVKETTGQLRKVTADSVVTVGDTTGLSTSLQDVRYQDGLLYAFWVPANNVDPLDIFDISQPEKGVQYISRLQFEGWISKSIPMSLDGRQFIIGLGWIIPAVDNERNMRKPQAMIFEIKKIGKKFKAEEVAQLSFGNSNVWTDFNASDKYIEVKMDGAGLGQILFSASQWDKKSYSSGGKLIQFDLHRILSGENEKALTEGVFLLGNSGWLRRVFTNPEIDRINTFSDQALGVYDTNSTSADNTVKAVATLELARQIRAYETMVSGKQTLGVQIISDWSWYGNSDESKTSLRLVDSRKADAELSQVTATQTLPGSYLSSLVIKDTLYVLSNTTTYDYTDTVYNYKSTNYFHTLRLDKNRKFVVNTHSWETHRRGGVMPVSLRISSGLYHGYSSGNLVAMNDGSVVIQIDGSLKIVPVTSSSEMPADIQTSHCLLEKRQDAQLSLIGNQIYFKSAELVQIKELDQVSALRNFIAKAEIKNGVLTCEKEVNIPGNLVTVSAADTLITDDTWVMDIVTKTSKYQTRDKTEERKYQELKTVKALMGLKLQKDQAVLADDMEIKSENYYGLDHHSVVPGELVRISTVESENRPIHYRLGMPRWNTYASDAAFEFITVDSEGFLSKELYTVELVGQSNSRLVGTESHPTKANTFLGLVQSGRSVQVVEWSTKTKRPEVQSLVALDEQLKPMEETQAVSVPGGSYYGYSERAYHFTPSQKSFELIQGLSGITQIYIK